MVFFEDNKRILENLYKKNKKAYLNLAYSILGNLDEVEDVLQSTFLELLDNRKILDVPKDKRDAYIFTYIKYTALNNGRHRKLVRDKIVKSIDDENYVEIIGEDYEDKEDLILQKLEVEVIKRILMQTDETLWTILSYKYILDKTDEEIAEKIGIGKDSVRMYLSRARKKVRKIYEEG
ncbi:MAG: RNA polymerase sigma factor [Clostridia bacterium]|nr:RNA polymerase sigma factor [Clostridia bacterium]